MSTYDDDELEADELDDLILSTLGEFRSAMSAYDDDGLEADELEHQINHPHLYGGRSHVQRLLDADGPIDCDIDSTVYDVDSVVANWQSKLLQLDRRNNLLYFKGNPEQATTPSRSFGSTRCVPIINLNIDEVDEFLSKRRKATFDFVDRRRNPRGYDSKMVSDDSDQHDIKVIPGKLTTDVEPHTLQGVLQRFSKKDREWEEEQGINVLFLAVGFLHWIDENGESVKSPLLLLPCDLERSSPRDAYVLKREDDEVATNATLRHKLQEEFNLNLPEFNHENYSDYLDAVGDIITDHPGWSISDEIILSVFPYTKMAMWDDLQQMRRVGITHPLVRRLAGAPQDSGLNKNAIDNLFPSDNELTGGRLDDIINLREEHVVTDADHSQLKAIAAARSGRDLVIHGPPGTGKSQTIVNVIANLIAHGKRVLFVSEKSVALNVVKERLERSNLGVFCLDMHSENGRKSSVYKQLHRSYNENIQQPDLGIDESLDEYRYKLNEVVRALHEMREPLGLSLYQIYGRYGRARDLPDIEFNVPNLSTFSREEYKELESTIERLALQSDEFLNTDTSVWEPLRLEAGSFGVADDIRRSTNVTLEAVRHLEEGIQQIADALEILSPSNLDQVVHLRDLVYHLENRPSLLEDWPITENIDGLYSLAVDEKDRQSEALQLANFVERTFGEKLPDIDFHRILEEVDNLDDSKYQVLTKIIGENWPDRLLPNPVKILSIIARVDDSAVEICNALVELSDKFGVESLSASLDKIGTALNMVDRISKLDIVHEEWADSDLLEDIKKQVNVAHGTAIKLDHEEKELFDYYDPEIMDDSSIDRHMLERLRTDHQSKFRRSIGKTYRRDRKQLSRFLKSPKRLELDDCNSVVTDILKIRSLRQDFDKSYEAVEKKLHRYANGRETDWDQVKQRMDAVNLLINDWPWPLDKLRTLLISREHRSALIAIYQKYVTASKILDAAIKELASNRINPEHISPANMSDLFSPARLLLESIVELVRPIIQQLKSVPSRWLEFRETISYTLRLQTICSKERASKAELTRSFGEWFDGRDTNWDSIIVTLKWYRELLDLVDGTLDGCLKEMACGRGAVSDCDVSYDSVEELRSSYVSELQVLNGRFDASRSAWRSWEGALFGDFKVWLSTINEKADSAENWIEFKHRSKRMDDLFGSGTVENIWSVISSTDQIPGIIERRLFMVWLSEIESRDPRIQDFTINDYEIVRRRFCELDRKLPQVLCNNVRSSCFAAYPTNPNIDISSGQIGTLRRELQKRRRQLSIRRLLTKSPMVIQALKPCFLMSPLGVSQYLERTDGSSPGIHFDTVIFDEASQIKPEDAVPAISRADQVIVVGDQKQLPPSNFFEHRNESDHDDDETEDEVDWLEGQESILDVMVGMASSSVDEHNLDVHYRSRHDSLIRYSNRHFYDDRLLTFPNPGIDDSLGVQSVYLPDGRYDVGGSRTNQVEAQKVVELVFEQLRTRPNESVGVVALSRNQADRIETLIDERRLSVSQFDDHFSPNKAERFFVKNLENVQGDERDHIILSVGYGPSTESGKVYNRFGPINSEGGERRLNVAVSRARRSMTLVHSLRPEDIVSESAGARLLRRYVEFAIDPETALEQNLTVRTQAETDSPFEEVVRRHLIERGHIVDVQVGVAGYRIDLAIKFENGYGYALGIECDGATYHSAPAARDRDWLRQSVLEGLGWRIHRVWSRSWIQDPEREIRKIEETLREQNRIPDNSPILEPSSSDSTTLETDRFDIDLLDSNDGDYSADLDAEDIEEKRESLFERYVVAGLDDVGCADWGSRPQLILDLKKLILTVVKVEGPVHRDIIIERIRVHEELGRVRGSKRDLIYELMGELVDDGELVWLPEQSDEGDHCFLVTSEHEKAIYPRAAYDEFRRDIEHIASEELSEGAFVCAQELYGSSFDDLVKHTARSFGFERSGPKVKDRIGRAVGWLIVGGRLIGGQDMLTPVGGP